MILVNEQIENETDLIWFSIFQGMHGEWCLEARL